MVELAAQELLDAMLARIADGLPGGVEVILVVVTEGKLVCGGSASMSEQRRRAALTAALGLEEGPRGVASVMAELERVLQGGTTGPDVGFSILSTLLCKTWREQGKDKGAPIEELFAVMRKIDHDVRGLLGIVGRAGKPDA